MKPTSVLCPPYVEYFRDFSRFRSWLWATAFAASILIHGFVLWQTSRYVPRPPREEVRVDVRMIELPPPVRLVEPPPPPPPPKPVPQPPKEVLRQAPLPVLAAPPAPAAPSKLVVAVQPPPAPLPPIDTPPPVPAVLPAPAAPPAVTPPAEDVDALIDGYGREVSRAFDAAKTYPRVAQMRNIEGQLMLRFDFVNGALSDVSVVEGSGQKVLDDAAVAAARKLKLPPPGGSLARRSFYFTMPVVYRLK